MKYAKLYLFIVSICFQICAAQDTTDLTAILDQLSKEVPQCALECMMKEIPNSTRPRVPAAAASPQPRHEEIPNISWQCSLTDTECICTNQDLSNSLLDCLVPSCTGVEQLQTQRFQKTTCGAPVHNVGGDVATVAWTLYSMVAFVVILRLLGRSPFLGGSYAWDDHIIIACTVILMPCTILAQLMVHNGLGQDIWMLSTDEIRNVLFYFFIEEYLYGFVVVFTKISILILYLRIFSSARAFTWQCYALLAMLIAFYISAILVSSLQCRPISYLWEGWDGMHSAACIDINRKTYAYAGINVGFDVIICALPIPQLIGLQMSIIKKVTTIAMFAVGLFVTACSIVRFKTILLGKSTNPTYDYATLAIWSLAEIDVAVICASMPGVARLIRRTCPQIFGTRDGSYPRSGYTIGSATGSLGKVVPGQKIRTKTSVSLSYSGKPKAPDFNNASADELELLPSPTGRTQLDQGIPERRPQW